jgi:hypothetical protein
MNDNFKEDNMNLSKKLILISTFTLISSHSFADAAARYDFNIPAFKTPTKETPKSKFIGELTFKNGTHLTAYSLTLVSGIAENGWETPEVGSPKLNSVLNPDLAKNLDAYAEPNGWIIVPKGWKPFSAASGPDGSVSLLFAPNKSGQMYLTYYSSGACMGCAESSASLFFPKARQSAKNNDFRITIILRLNHLRP